MCPIVVLNLKLHSAEVPGSIEQGGPQPPLLQPAACYCQCHKPALDLVRLCGGQLS